MATPVNVFALPFDLLRAVPGSRDTELIEAVRSGHTASDAEAARREADEECEPGEESEITFMQAVEQFINGEPPGRTHPLVWGAVFYAIVWTMGDFDDGWAVSWRNLKKLDSLLHDAGSPVGVHELCFRGSYLDLPADDDGRWYGSTGYWTPEEVNAVAFAVGRLSVRTVGQHEREQVDAVGRWVADPAQYDNVGLIGFT